MFSYWKMTQLLSEEEAKPNTVIPVLIAKRMVPQSWMSSRILGSWPSNQSTLLHILNTDSLLIKACTLVISWDDSIVPAPKATSKVWSIPLPLHSFKAAGKYLTVLTKCSIAMIQLPTNNPQIGLRVYIDNGNVMRTTCSIQLGKERNVFCGHSVMHSESPHAQPLICL